jgi:hypothetical protein
LDNIFFGLLLEYYNYRLKKSGSLFSAVRKCVLDGAASERLRCIIAVYSEKESIFFTERELFYRRGRKMAEEGAILGHVPPSR